MLADPQSLTIAGSTATALPRTGSDPSGVFRSADGSAVLRVTHSYGKRNRRTVRVEHTKVSPDPLTQVNALVGASAYIVIDEPREGYTDDELKTLVSGLCSWLTASSGAQLAKILGGEQ